MPTLTAPVQLADRLTTEERFHRLAAEWKEQARYMSDSRRMVMLRPYQAIIGMGLPVVPALEVIADENLVQENARGDIQLIADAWIEWGRREGLIK